MGKFSPDMTDQAQLLGIGVLAAVGNSAWVGLNGRANLFVTGAFTGSCHVERSFDGGETAVPVTLGDGTVRAVTGPEGLVIDEPERGMLYRLVCDTLTAGAVTWRFSA